MTGTKICSACLQEKTLDAFSIKKQSTGLRQKKCKPCRVIEQRARSSAPGAKARKAEYDAIYWEENRERLIRLMRGRYEADRDNRIEQVREYNRRNPHVKAAVGMKRRALKKSAADPDLTPEVFKRWLDAQEKICVWCAVACEDDYEIDHVMPLTRGGVHTLTNLAICCFTCNRRKNNTLPIEYAVKLHNERVRREILLLTAVAA